VVAPSDVHKEQESNIPQGIQEAAAPGDEASFTANEHGLNFLGDSEVEKVSGPPEGSAPAAPPVSNWAEEVENGQHHGEVDTGRKYESFTLKDIRGHCYCAFFCAQI
jgi:hypothetical protein